MPRRFLLSSFKETSTLLKTDYALWCHHLYIRVHDTRDAHISVFAADTRIRIPTQFVNCTFIS